MKITVTSVPVEDKIRLSHSTLMYLVLLRRQKCHLASTSG